MSHIFIYLDESGCVGSKSHNSSQYFVITLLKIEGADIQRKVINAVKRTIKNKISIKNKKLGYELKGSKTRFSEKEYFIKQMPREGWNIYSIILNKKRVEPYFQTKEGKNKFYNLLVKVLMTHLKLDTNISRLDLYLDKCKNTKEQKDFNSDIISHMNLPSHIPFNIDHVLSHEHPAIQAVDLFCWGVARKYEATDTKWYIKFSEYINYEEIQPLYKNEKAAIPLALVP